MVFGESLVNGKSGLVNFYVADCLMAYPRWRIWYNILQNTFFCHIDAVTVVLYNSFNGLTQGSGSTVSNFSYDIDTNSTVPINSVSPVTASEVKCKLKFIALASSYYLLNLLILI